jgi:hypothetical protein
MLPLQKLNLGNLEEDEEILFPNMKVQGHFEIPTLKDAQIDYFGDGDQAPRVHERV